MLSSASVHIRRVSILLGLAFVVSSCASYKPASEAFHKVLSLPYTLDSGDRVRVTVFDQANLTNIYAVNKGGHLSFPLVGSVVARGKTAKQLEGDIAARLRNGFLRDPDVSVEIDRYRPFFVMGEVGSSGQYTYVPGMTVQNAIAIAGGFSPRAEQRNADITRHVNGSVVTGRVAISDPIVPGDTIYVRERLF